MKRAYTVEEDRLGNLPPMKRTYQGFDRRIDKRTQFVALVYREDYIDTFALENMEAVAELQRFIREQEEPHSYLIGVFGKQG